MSNINQALNHVFIHVPKTGGTSMERQPWVGGNGHANILGLRDQFTGSQEQWDSMFKWGFVRDPVARFCSTHRAFLQHGNETGIPESIDEWVKYFEKPSHLWTWAHTIPQYNFLYYPDGKRGVDYIGQVEHIQSDWEFVCRKVGQEPIKLESLNQTTLEGWAAPSEDTIRRIKWLYSMDYILLGYTTDFQI